MEIMSRCGEQWKGPDGFRRSRWIVIRNTFPELCDTSLKTWLDWFPDGTIGKFNWNKMVYTIDYGDIKSEIMFRALDRPDDVKKLLSLEVTGGWINEAKEVPKVILDVLGDRVGQYPSARNGGCKWAGVIMDTNPPDNDHWWYKLAEENTPVGWKFFRQPGGLIEKDGEFFNNPIAENVKNLNDPDYYIKRLGGKSKEYIRVYYCGEYGFVQDGKPVHPEYIDSLHCSSEEIKPVFGLPLKIGYDFGLTPACVIGQKLPNGRWIIIDEVVSEDMGIVNFCELGLIPKIRAEYSGFDLDVAWGDPAGDKRADTDEKTPFQILNSKGLNARPCFTNDPTVRRESVSVPFGRIIDGKPGVLISPKCKVLRKGLAGGYHYKRVQISGEERYRDEPYKNSFSHVVEAFEYLLAGNGEGKSILGKKSMSKPKTVTQIMKSINFGRRW